MDTHKTQRIFQIKNLLFNYFQSKIKLKSRLHCIEIIADHCKKCSRVKTSSFEEGNCQNSTILNNDGIYLTKVQITV